MRIALALVLLAAACDAPCVSVCADNTECPLGSTCVNHQACLQNCIMCGGACVADTFHNCEACATACASGQVCSAGKCSASCQAGYTPCGAGSCYNLQTDRFNCGTCGHACGGELVCDTGSCRPLVSCG